MWDASTDFPQPAYPLINKICGEFDNRQDAYYGSCESHANVPEVISSMLDKRPSQGIGLKVERQFCSDSVKATGRRKVHNM